MNGLKFWNALKFGFPSFLKPHAYLDILLKKTLIIINVMDSIPFRQHSQHL